MRLLVLAAVLLAPLPANAAITQVRVLSQVDGGPIDDTPKHARASQTVTLYAVVWRAEGADAPVVFADAAEIRVGQRRLVPRPLAEAGPLAVRWAKVEPSVPTLSNTETGTFAYATIPYAATPVPAWDERGRVRADVHPTLVPDYGAGLGTMRYQVSVVGSDGARVASPGTSARRGRGAGGLDDRVMRVSIRSGDDYLGWLSELYGQPYIWASAGATAATHQSERLEGADCADLIVYGWRRLGRAIDYTWTGGLPKLTQLIAAGTPGDDGIYRDARGRALPFTRSGDILLFPRHVGVLVRDAGTPGVLDRQDIMLHTLFAPPRQQPIADSGYGDGPVELRRLR